MDTRTWIRKRGWGVVIGAIVTLVGCIAFACGLLTRLDRFGLDRHFRYCSQLPADDSIVLIDINDHALYAVDPWPWPRRRHAQLVRTLSELGARAVLLDFVFDSPSAPRYAGAPGISAAIDLPVIGDPSRDPLIDDDSELQQAIAQAGNVYTAMFSSISPPGVDPEAVVDTAIGITREDPSMDLAGFRSALGAEPPWSTERFFQTVRIAVLLEEDYGLETEELAERLSPNSAADSIAIEANLPAAKRLVARRTALRFLTEDPKGDWSTFFSNVLPGRALDALTADRKDLLDAFQTARSVLAIGDALAQSTPANTDRLPGMFDLTVPLERFSSAARGVGFAMFDREDADGVVRDVPLLARRGDKLVSQLAFLVATDLLAIDRTSLLLETGRLTLVSSKGNHQLPLSPEGSTLINWHVPPDPHRWQDSFMHIPVTRVLEPALNIEAIKDNKTRLRLAWAELVRSRHEQTPAEYARYEEIVNENISIGRRLTALSTTVTPGKRQTFETRSAELDRDIRQMEEEALVWFDRLWRLWKDEQPQTEEEKQERDEIERLHARFADGRLEKHFKTVNEDLSRRVEERLAELRPNIDGKICIVGYTASAVAELVATPISGSVPGVMVHANILNMILQDRPVFPAPLWINACLIFACGLTAAVATSMRGPWFGVLSLCMLLAVVIIGGAATFAIATYYISTAPMALVMCGVWAAVTAFRQATEERARRQFQRALSQYASPAIAARIAQHADSSHLKPQSARVSCFFSDLAGFTRLSERLGPSQTRSVLNPYLEMVSRALVENHALVNKFMGDGVFAFFNAPVWPCPNPARAACSAALASVRALVELNRKPLTSDSAGRLVMRIGLSTGDAFVGDYGSDAKLEYTCIGDTVNLASRLEKANAVFGTRVLVDAGTRDSAGEEFAFRSLGRLLLPGRSAAADAYELVARTEETDEAARESIRRFQAAVSCFQACEWDSCMKLLRECRKQCEDDRAIRVYEDAVTRRRKETIESDWDGAIDISTK